MAEYGYSTPYKGMQGSPLPPGYMEAATAPGRYLSQGIASLGDSILEGLREHKAKRDESESAMATADALKTMASSIAAPRMQEIQHYYENGTLPPGIDQESFGRYSSQVMAQTEPVQKIAEIYSKLPTMSLTAKKSALGDMMMLLNQYQTGLKDADEKVVRDLNLQKMRNDQVKQEDEKVVRDLNLQKMLNDQVKQEDEKVVRDLEIDKLRLDQAKAIDKLNQQQEIPKAVQFALTNPQTKAAPENLYVMDPETGKNDPTKVGVAYKSYDELRKDLATYMAATGSSSETYSALDSIMALAGKTRENRTIPGIGQTVTLKPGEQLVQPKDQDHVYNFKLKAMDVDSGGYYGSAPTPEEAIKFREKASNQEGIEAGVNELKQFLNLSTIMRQLPENRAKMNSIVQTLQALKRIELVGPGTISAEDQKRLDRAIASPDTIFRMDRGILSSLDNLVANNAMGLDKYAKSIGLKKKESESGKETKSNGSTGLKRYQFDPFTNTAK